MSGSRNVRWLRMLAVTAAVVAVASLSACGGSSSSGDSSTAASSDSLKPVPGTINVWLAGLFAGATPGSPYRNWIDAQNTRFEKLYPGSKVNITLLPTNNDQFSAKLQAAFTSGKCPT